MDFVRDMNLLTGLATHLLVAWLGVARGKFYDWRGRYGKMNEHNRLVPRDHWITAEERKRIVAFHADYPLEEYRGLTFMMLDSTVVAVSPTTTWRVLSDAGVLDRWTKRPSKKGTAKAAPSCIGKCANI